MDLDQAVSAGLAQPPWTLLQPFGQAMELLGGMLPWYALVALLAWRRRWGIALPLLAALLASDASAFALKHIVARHRPSEVLFGLPFRADDASFPSGHAVRAAAAAGVAWLAGVPRAWRAGTAAFALLMAVARLVIEAHWLTDVLAGLALGAAIGAVMALAWRRDVAGVRRRLEARLPA
ncbi:MAG: phosphatase PAP2 family protein [Halobacteriales archaeon]|nr:phosphatase PAP2 family protein [Halobacteriales archaeon]